MSLSNLEFEAMRAAEIERHQARLCGREEGDLDDTPLSSLEIVGVVLVAIAIVGACWLGGAL